MPKYKYVDGEKYRVVPQSVLGYALVKEGSDNSLPAGGTDGQVLAKASNTDYDVEWATVESGGGDVYCVDFTATSPNDTSATTDATFESITEAITSGKNVIARLHINDNAGDAFYLVQLVQYVSYEELLIPVFNSVINLYSPAGTLLDIVNIRIAPNMDLTGWTLEYKYWLLTQRTE